VHGGKLNSTQLNSTERSDSVQCSEFSSVFRCELSHDGRARLTTAVSDAEVELYYYFNMYYLQEAQLTQTDRARLRVIEYFAKSLMVS